MVRHTTSKTTWPDGLAQHFRSIGGSETTYPSASFACTYQLRRPRRDVSLPHVDSKAISRLDRFN
jgi:hypothetical protein